MPVINRAMLYRVGCRTRWETGAVGGVTAGVTPTRGEGRPLQMMPRSTNVRLRHLVRSVCSWSEGAIWRGWQRSW